MGMTCENPPNIGHIQTQGHEEISGENLSEKDCRVTERLPLKILICKNLSKNFHLIALCLLNTMSHLNNF